MSADVDPAIADGPAQAKLRILTAMQTGLRRYDEVLAVVRTCNDRNEATAAVQALLGFDRMQAQVILNMQWDRLTVHSIEQVESELLAETSRLANP